MDHGGEALICLVGAHGDAFELLEPAEEVLHEMPPFVHLLVDGEMLCASRMLGDDDLGAARVEFGDNGLPGWRRSADRTTLHANSLVSGNFTGNFAILGL
jgi:hypothetical protein